MWQAVLLVVVPIMWQVAVTATAVVTIKAHICVFFLPWAVFVIVASVGMYHICVCSIRNVASAQRQVKAHICSYFSSFLAIFVGMYVCVRQFY